MNIQSVKKVNKIVLISTVYRRNNIEKINVRERYKKEKKNIPISNLALKRWLSPKFINNNPKLSFLTKKTALNLNQPYSNEYWIPGLLTNWNGFQTTIKSFQYCDQYFGAFLKKKKIVFPKYLKQKKKLEGLTLLKSRPDVLVLFQLVGNESILKEAQLLNIPVVAFSDCTKSFFNVDYPIPMDTNVFSMTYLFCSFLCKR